MHDIAENWREGYRLETDGFEGDRQLGQEDTVSQEFRVVDEGLFGGQTSEFRNIVGFRQVAEDDAVGGSVVVVGEELGGGVVGEVADAGENTLLNRPGVGTVAQHLEVVVGFDEQNIDLAESGLDVGRQVAEVGGDGHADGFSTGVEDEATGIGGVVRDGEGGDIEVADREINAGAEVLDRGEGGGIDFFARLGGAAKFFFVGVDGEFEGGIRIVGAEGGLRGGCGGDGELTYIWTGWRRSWAARVTFSC